MTPHCQFKNISFKLINVIKYIVISHSFKSYIKLLVKVLCLSVLFYGGIEVTKEYFSYPYVYRLSVKPSEGLYLPPISICTERDVLFDKTRIIDYFNISQDYESYKLDSIQKAIQLESECMKEHNFYVDNSLSCKVFGYYKNYLFNKYFIEYKTQMLSNMTFTELYDKFTVKANQLIKCTYFRHKTNSNNNNSSDSQVMTDCSQSYAVLETIYGNKDFGICFTYFYTNHYNYYLIDDDFIQFDISFETQQKFISSGYYDEYYNKIYDSFIRDPYNLFDVRDLYLKDNFGLYIFVNPMTEPLMASKETSIKTTRIGLNGRLKITSTHLQLLSKPYMKSCREYGIVYYVKLYNSIII